MILRHNYSKWSGGVAVFYIDGIQPFLNITKIRCTVGEISKSIIPPFKDEFIFDGLIDDTLYEATLEYELNDSGEFVEDYRLGFVCEKVTIGEHIVLDNNSNMNIPVKSLTHISITRDGRGIECVYC